MNEVPSPKAPARTITRIVSFLSLYVSAASFLTFIFAVIDYAFPDKAASYNFFRNSPYETIQNSFPVFVVSFVIFVASLFVLRNSNLIKDGTNYSIGWKRFIYVILSIISLTYIFAAIGEISVWIQGDLFSRFALKMLAMILVPVCIALYYTREYRGVWATSAKKHNLFVGLVSLLALFTIVISFVLVGTPSYHRNINIDISRRSTVESFKYAIECGCNDGILPSDSEVNNETENKKADVFSKYSYYLKDIEKKPITYKKLSETQYQICAAFAYDSTVLDQYIEDNDALNYSNVKWSYTKNGCQTFTYDSSAYDDGEDMYGDSQDDSPTFDAEEPDSSLQSGPISTKIKK